MTVSSSPNASADWPTVVQPIRDVYSGGLSEVHQTTRFQMTPRGDNSKSILIVELHLGHSNLDYLVFSCLLLPSPLQQLATSSTIAIITRNNPSPTTRLHPQPIQPPTRLSPIMSEEKGGPAKWTETDKVGFAPPIAVPSIVTNLVVIARHPLPDHRIVHRKDPLGQNRAARGTHQEGSPGHARQGEGQSAQGKRPCRRQR